MSIKLKIDGPFLRVEGDCPMCDWTQPHTHVKDIFHEFIEKRNKDKHPSTGKKTTTNADKPAPAKVSGVTIGKLQTPGGTTTVKTKPADPPKTKKINVYRIRTIGGSLNLDRSVVGNKKKEAINKARDSHARMLQLTESDVRIVFCRYIGQYAIPEPTYSKYGGYAGMWDWD